METPLSIGLKEARNRSHAQTVRKTLAPRAATKEAKTNLSKLLEAVARGERVVITRHGIPAAELVAARPTKVKLGGLKEQVSPPPDDFFEPLSEEELRDWEGE